MAVLSSSAIRVEAAKIKNELRDRGLHHADNLTMEELCKVYARFSSLPVAERVALAADALVQWPRPFWLMDLLGSHAQYPLDLEMTNPADIASPEEWGKGYGSVA